MNKKIVISYVIGTALEVYEFTIFGMLASVLAEHFFSGYENHLRMELIFITFALGFFVRPISAFFYGQWGDTRGRKTPFFSTIILMATATFLIGILPTYVSIGVLSTALLIFLRIIQGVAVSGEYPGALTMLYEQSAPNDAKLYTSLSMAATFMGMLLASITIVLLNYGIGEKAVQEWGWRIPFIAALLLGFIGVFLRKNMQESMSFVKLKMDNELHKFPMKLLFKNYKKEIFLMIVIFQLSVVLSYATFVYLPNARILYFNHEFTNVYLANAINLLVVVISIPILAKYVPSMRTVRLMIFSALLIAFSVFFMFKWSMHIDFIYFMMSQFILAILGAVFVAGFPYMLAKTFSADVRYSGNGLVLNIASGCFAGITPYLLTLIHQSTNSVEMPAVYIIFSASLAIGGLCFLYYSRSNSQFNKKV